ncbi:MAG TPA: c-type cytochrome [Candidatus Methylomirabilis sp.]|nr:c-type cytochrome [Candidatus Methylomirabilis sp.]
MKGTTVGGIVRVIKWGFSAALVAVVLGGSLDVARAAKQSEERSEIERGRYLVEEVAKCAECHTPRDANGNLIQSEWLQGAPIWILPVRPIQNWAERAPALAGFPSFTEAEGERVLEKGTGPEGETLRPPMHIYHMSHEDARAIIAYLKSLPMPKK